MLEKKQSSISVNSLATAIKDFDGKPLSLFEQRDVDEFLNLLFDQLEGQISSSKNPHLIQNCFGGQYSNTINPQPCNHKK